VDYTAAIDHDDGAHRMPSAAAQDQPPMSARHAALARFIHDHAVRRGTFTLASGRTSDFYCDGKLVSFHPRGIGLIVDAILEELADLDVDAIGGMDMGATPIVSAVAMGAAQRGRPLPSFVVRKETKAHGTKKPVEGPIPPAPARVAIVDDVVTSGGSIIKAIDCVRELGYEVALALSVLDREEGGAEALAAKNVPYRSLVRRSELPGE
jgi:orotate phosphoribosyltransferase